MIKNGTRGWIEACNHGSSEKVLKENYPNTSGIIVYDKVQKCYQLRIPTKGTIKGNLFIPDKGQEVNYPIEINKVFEKEFKSLL